MNALQRLPAVPTAAVKLISPWSIAVIPHSDSPSSLEETGDRRLLRRVEAYLSTRSYPALRDIEISASDGVVTITGTVPTFHQKQVAYLSCRRVAGVLDVVDLIDVDPTQVRDHSSESSWEIAVHMGFDVRS